MKQHYILDSAATLLGVALVVVTAVHISGRAEATIADELAFLAAIFFLASCGASHWAITKSADRFERIADGIFAAALLLLFISVLTLWI
jgi:hypothetical protein